MGKTDKRKNVENAHLLLKKGIWLYFFLLIFEGALRKWILPGFATPLLVIRDPIALWLIVTAYNKGLLPSNLYLNGVVILGFVGIVTSVLFGHGNLLVALFGARTLLLHFPLIFVIGRIFDRADVLKMGKITLMIAAAMAVLVALQFYSPQSAWVNRGVGGDLEGAGFTGAMGYSRPPGTFSFTNGVTLFYSFATCFVFYFLLNSKLINKLLLIAATTGLLVVIPLSISRGLFFSVGVIGFFVIIAASRKPRYLTRMLIAVLAVVLIILVANQFAFFRTATEVFTARFTNANESEGGLEGVFLDRYFGGLLSSFTLKSGLPVFGYGLGKLTNVGTMLLSGKTISGLAEGEWGRMIAESGPFLGLLLVFFRIGLSFKLALLSFQRLGQGDILPWVLMGFCLIIFPQGNWAQPTSLGFSTLITGLVLASFRGPLAFKDKMKGQKQQ